jgi:hypothetical protein
MGWDSGIPEAKLKEAGFSKKIEPSVDRHHSYSSEFTDSN